MLCDQNLSRGKNRIRLIACVYNVILSRSVSVGKVSSKIKKSALDFPITRSLSRLFCPPRGLDG